jgi:hypothetical protein
LSKQPNKLEEHNKQTVIISFDAEFSINGAFTDSEHKKPCADSIFAPNPLGTEGLQDILTILTKHQVKTTFFTEVLNSYYFGENKMLHYVRKMQACSQDVQLHTHPCWLVFKDKNWQEGIASRLVRDDFDETSKDDIVKILQECLTIFEHWKLPKPSTYRAGNLHPNLALYDALHELDFVISSSIDLPIYTPKEPQLHINNEVAFFHHIAEIPVTSFKSMGIRDKALTITGSSFYEIKDALNRYDKKGNTPIVLLSHVHEFIKKDSSTGKVKKNTINLNRLDKLCHFVKQNDNFEFKTFDDLAKVDRFRKQENNEQPKKISIIKTSLASGLWTLIQNKLNDSIWQL